MKVLKIWKQAVLFVLGGAGYVGLEYLWRGWSQYSMFFAGGSAFLLLGGLNRAEPKLPLPLRSVVGAGVVTGVELAAGLLVNRAYQVWDYRGLPLNFHGQICVPFTLLWIPVSAGAMVLYDRLERRLFSHRNG